MDPTYGYKANYGDYSEAYEGQDYDNNGYNNPDYDGTHGYDLQSYEGYDASQYDAAGTAGSEPQAPVVVEGFWAEHSSFFYESYGVTSIVYDNYKDLIWASYGNGRVSSFTFTYTPIVENEVDRQTDHVPDMVQPLRYSSFMASDTAVSDVIPLGSSIASISQSQLRLHSDGGLVFGTICSAVSFAERYVPAEDVQGLTFSCGAALYHSSGMVGGEDRPTHLVAGTSTKLALAFDVHMLDANPVIMYDVSAPTVCIRANGRRVALGGADGKVRLVDGRLRSRTIDAVLDAHSGSVSDMCLQPDGYTVLTCGIISRPVNPYDPKSPVNYVSDPLVKVFDLRMNRQLSPMSMSVGSPSILRFIPAPVGYPGLTEAAILMASSSGVVQITPLHADPAAAQIVYAPLAERKEVVSAVGVSSSGQLLSMGTSIGNVMQFALGLSGGANTRINETSVPVHIPSAVPPPPLVSLDIDAPILGTSYVLLPTKNTDPMPLSSSFIATPAVLKRRLKLTSSRRISEDVLKRVNKKDFIGTVPNPGFKPNSMIYGIGGKKAYAMCDPRKKLEGELGPDGQPLGELDVITAETTPTPGSQGIRNIPTSMRKMQSHRGKQRIKKFDYASLNSSLMVGLENTAPNSYTNPFLQVMFTLPEIRTCALAAQTSGYHHTSSSSIWCELGFLFHMMTEVIASTSKNVQKVVTPANFQRTFQQVPEAVALGLFDTASADPTAARLDAQQLSQTFSRFLLQQLHRELDLEHAASLPIIPTNSTRRQLRAHANAAPPPAPAATPATTTTVIEKVFGFSNSTTTTFLQSGTVERGSVSQVFSLDVAYPLVGKPGGGKGYKGGKGGKGSGTNTASAYAAFKTYIPSYGSSASSSPNPVPVPVVSFASVLWGSLLRETQMRGWCSASESYEPFKQVRSPITLPRILTLLCGDTVRDPKESTISGALGEIASTGSMHANFWSRMLTLKKDLSLNKPSTSISGGGADTSTGSGDQQQQQQAGEESVEDDQLEGKELECYWLPEELEICIYRGDPELSNTSSPTKGGSSSSDTSSKSKHALSDRLLISCKLAGHVSAKEESTKSATGSETTETASISVSVATAAATGTAGDTEKDLAVASNTGAGSSPPRGFPEVWAIFDGTNEIFSDRPASQLGCFGVTMVKDINPLSPSPASASSSSSSSGVVVPSIGWDVSRYNLCGLVSLVGSFTSKSFSSPKNELPQKQHSILHIRHFNESYDATAKATAAANDRGSGVQSQAAAAAAPNWWLVNDFLVQPNKISDVLAFPDWRHPSTVFFSRQDFSFASTSTSSFAPAPTRIAAPTAATTVAVVETPRTVPMKVLLLPSLSQSPCVRLVAPSPSPLNPSPTLLTVLPGPGDLIAFDGEFVSVQAERVALNAEGQRVVIDEGRQLLARISLIDERAVDDNLIKIQANGRTFRVLVDDYILPCEPVVDYVTRFSGITMEDLSPATSRHALVPYRTAYLKLRFFLDRGCIFVGHGLQKDFETANIFAPPDQVRDTVELWRLPNQRKISLRFLASYLLKEDIQDEIHDSIEDAKTALLLYRHYEEVAAKGPEHLSATLSDLYAYGMRTNWTIGMEKLGGSGGMRVGANR